MPIGDRQLSLVIIGDGNPTPTTKEHVLSLQFFDRYNSNEGTLEGLIFSFQIFMFSCIFLFVSNDEVRHWLCPFFLPTNFFLRQWLQHSISPYLPSPQFFDWSYSLLGCRMYRSCHKEVTKPYFLFNSAAFLKNLSLPISRFTKSVSKR